MQFASPPGKFILQLVTANCVFAISQSGCSRGYGFQVMAGVQVLMSFGPPWGLGSMAHRVARDDQSLVGFSAGIRFSFSWGCFFRVTVGVAWAK